MKKRSVSIMGHATSITMEDEFWDALKSIAAQQNTSLNAMIGTIDQSRAGRNLSSAIRVYVLKSLRQL